jgi:hypothetical protein
MDELKQARARLIKKYEEKEYLGDSVYVRFDGYHLVLETHNGYEDDPRNVIALEPPVMDKLIKHREQLYKDFEKLREAESEERNKETK